MPFIEATQLTKDWLRDPENGVNAMLRVVPRIDGHREPPPVAVYSEEDDEELFTSEDLEPPQRPAVLVMADGEEVEEMGLRGRRPGLAVDATIAIVYVADGDLAPIVSRRDTNYTLRAIARSMNAWKSADSTKRKLNGITVVEIKTVRMMKAEGFAGRARLEGVALVDVLLMDTQP